MARLLRPPREAVLRRDARAKAGPSQVRAQGQASGRGKAGGRPSKSPVPRLPGCMMHRVYIAPDSRSSPHSVKTGDPPNSNGGAQPPPAPRFSTWV